MIKKRFDDCPYGCNTNGMLLDDTLGRLVPCPYCSTLKKELVKKGELIEEESNSTIPLEEALGIKNNSFLSDRFIYDVIIPEGEKFFLEHETLERQQSIAEELYLGLGVGTLPDSSLCFGLTRVGDIEKFAYPLLVKAYKSGLSIGKLYTAREINEGFLNQTIPSSDLYGVDFLIIFFSEDSDNACAHTVQGVLQSRSLKAKPTVVVTTAKIEACSQFLGYWNNASYSLATPVFAEYKAVRKKGYSRYINNLLGLVNANVNTNDNVKDVASSPESNSDSSGRLTTTMSDLLSM